MASTTPTITTRDWCGLSAYLIGRIIDRLSVSDYIRCHVVCTSLLHIAEVAKILLLGHRQTKIHNIGARLVGVDKFGNKYYEKLQDTQFGRHRWVEYAKKGRYDASQVPPEWHGWLHHITDHTGDELLMLKPSRYGLEHRENLLSGEADEHANRSKARFLSQDREIGAALNPGSPQENEKKL